MPHTPNLRLLRGTLDFDESVQDLADVFYDLGGPGPRERFIDYAQRVSDALAEAGYAIVPNGRAEADRV